MSLVDSAPPIGNRNCEERLRGLVHRQAEAAARAHGRCDLRQPVLSRAREPAVGSAARDREAIDDENVRLKDELDLGVLDQVSMAGDCFDRLLSVETRGQAIWAASLADLELHRL